MKQEAKEKEIIMQKLIEYLSFTSFIKTKFSEITAYKSNIS